MSAVLRAVIEEGCADEAFELGEGLSVEACASAVMATVHGYLSLSATAPHLIPAGTAASATWEMACGLLHFEPGKQHGQR